MYSCPGETSTGTMCPGNLVANAASPGAPTARYSVMKIEPPPATRLSTPNSPPPPANWVCVVIWMELPIHESSPASEMTDSLGSSTNSSTGIVVPVMRDCMMSPREKFRFRVPAQHVLCHPERSPKFATRTLDGVERPRATLRHYWRVQAFSRCGRGENASRRQPGMPALQGAFDSTPLRMTVHFFIDSPGNSICAPQCSAKSAQRGF